MANALTLTVWFVVSCVSAELLGYGLHRLLHSGVVGFLSRNHMKHHMVLYGPLQEQRSKQYRDATDDSISLGNIGIEWLIPAAVLIVCVLGLFHLFHVRLLYRLIYFATTLGWSFLMFSYLHDAQHIEGYWMERSRFLKGWFVSARNLHEIHHQVINDEGLMDRNFGIAFFFFDRLFGTLSAGEPRFNYDGYLVAQKRFRSTISGGAGEPQTLAARGKTPGD